MNTARAIETFTEEQYLAFERASVEKHEYWRGYVLAMAGASHRHLDVCSNLHRLLAVALLRGTCKVTASDQRVYIQTEKMFTYPDLTIVCGPREIHRLREGEALLNPAVAVEVLSKSTRAYDTGDKLAFYKSIPSLHDILLVDPRDLSITRWSRASKRWSSKRFVEGEVPLASLEIAIPVADVFADIAPLSEEHD